MYFTMENSLTVDEIEMLATQKTAMKKAVMHPAFWIDIIERYPLSRWTTSRLRDFTAKQLRWLLLKKQTEAKQYSIESTVYVSAEEIAYNQMLNNDHPTGTEHVGVYHGVMRALAAQNDTGCLNADTPEIVYKMVLETISHRHVDLLRRLLTKLTTVHSSWISEMVSRACIRGDYDVFCVVYDWIPEGSVMFFIDDIMEGGCFAILEHIGYTGKPQMGCHGDTTPSQTIHPEGLTTSEVSHPEDIIVLEASHTQQDVPEGPTTSEVSHPGDITTLEAPHTRRGDTEGPTTSEVPCDHQEDTEDVSSLGASHTQQGDTEGVRPSDRLRMGITSLFTSHHVGGIDLDIPDDVMESMLIEGLSTTRRKMSGELLEAFCTYVRGLSISNAIKVLVISYETSELCIDDLSCDEAAQLFEMYIIIFGGRCDVDWVYKIGMKMSMHADNRIVKCISDIEVLDCVMHMMKLTLSEVLELCAPEMIQQVISHLGQPSSHSIHTQQVVPPPVSHLEQPADSSDSYEEMTSVDESDASVWNMMYDQSPSMGGWYQTSNEA